ncbi:MAG: hypothetical protein HY744_12485, partial [Deltaproteobacteria bacterium]|nr:hypothetical protein [Deltaproteobacteria bacterium]
MRVRKVGADGIIRTVAGSGAYGSSGDGGPATQAAFKSIAAVAVSADGSLLVVDVTDNRVRRVGPDGIIRPAAGTGVYGFAGDGGPATAARLASPMGLALGPDCSFYIADTYNRRIRRVTADGTIYTVAGGGGAYAPGPATSISLGYLGGVAVGPDGSIYIADQGIGGYGVYLRRVGLDGILQNIAGKNYEGATGDGGPALEARLSAPRSIAVSADGNVYFSVGNVMPSGPGAAGVRRVSPDGIISLVAGTYDSKCRDYFCGEGGPAAAAQFSVPAGVSLGPVGADGSLYLADRTAGRVFRIAAPLPGLSLGDFLLPSEDGSEVYVFGPTGKHKETKHALLGTTLQSFGYDDAGRLETVTDVDGLVTHVLRDADGNPTAIVGPYGQVTALALGPDGYLASVTNPAGESVAMSYAPGGLLAAFTDPRGYTTSFEHDAGGRVTRATDPLGASRTWVRTPIADGWRVERTSALGRVTTYDTVLAATGSRVLTKTLPSGLSLVTELQPNGTSLTTQPDGTMATSISAPDPRFGMLSAFGASRRTSTPGNIVSLLTIQRTVTLASPTNVLSLLTETDRSTLNGKTTTTVFDAPSRTSTTNSPSGRKTSVTVDAKGRPASITLAPSLHPVELSYDAAGRLIRQVQGAREWSYLYDPAGELASVTNPLLQTESYSYDA